MKEPHFAGESCWYFWKTHALPGVVLYDTYLTELPLCYYAMPELNNWQPEFNGEVSGKKNISLVIITIGAIVSSG